MKIIIVCCRQKSSFIVKAALGSDQKASTKFSRPRLEYAPSPFANLQLLHLLLLFHFIILFNFSFIIALFAFNFLIISQTCTETTTNAVRTILRITRREKTFNNAFATAMQCINYSSTS